VDFIASGSSDQSAATVPTIPCSRLPHRSQGIPHLIKRYPIPQFNPSLALRQKKIRRALIWLSAPGSFVGTEVPCAMPMCQARNYGMPECGEIT